MLAAPLQALSRLLDAIPDAVVLLDERGEVVFANRRAGELFGATAAELMELGVDELVCARTRRAGRVSERIWALAGGGLGEVGPSVELRARHRDGHELPVQITFSQASMDDATLIVATIREAGDPDRGEAMQRLAAVVRSSPDAILTKDLNGAITSWNQGAERMYGYTAAETIGRPVSMLMDAARKRESTEILERIRRGEVLDRVETVRVRKDGRALDVSVSVSPVRDRHGQIVGAATVARDITERRRAEQRFRALLESAPDAVVVVSEDERIVLVNRQTEELFGYSREQLLGSAAAMLIAERLRDLGRFTSSTGAALELDGVRADGSEFPIEVTLSPLSTDEGAMVYAAIRDITSRKLMEDELRRSNHDLEQFAYVASHDLSEPLRVISGFVELLSRRYSDRLDAEGDRFIGFIISGVERMQALIDDLLAYSRAGRATFQPREVDTAAVAGDLLRALRPELETRQVQVQVGELPTVKAEKPLLRQIFQNLISNAIKFSDASEPVVRIEAARVPGAWRFDVSDNGPGIEPRYRERIFEMFQRLHGRDVAGSGIGLAIVKRLVERHGGRVWASAAEPHGATFSFTIPDRAAG